MQRISVNLTTDCGKINLTCNYYAIIMQELCTTATFQNKFFDTVIGKIICNNYFIVKFIKIYFLIFNWIVWSIFQK